MKSPWRFLGSLISRGRSTEPDDVGDRRGAGAQMEPDETQDTPALQHPPSEAAPQSPADNVAHIPEAGLNNSSEIPLTDVAPSSDSAERQTHNRANRAQIDTSTKPKRSGAGEGKPPETQVKRAVRAKKATTGTDTRRAGVPNGSQQKSLAAFTHHNPYAELETVDAEIQQLRRQLAQALTLQNAQLKRMLERFGAS